MVELLTASRSSCIIMLKPVTKSDCRRYLHDILMIDTIIGPGIFIDVKKVKKTD